MIQEYILESPEHSASSQAGSLKPSGPARQPATPQATHPTAAPTDLTLRAQPLSRRRQGDESSHFIPTTTLGGTNYASPLPLKPQSPPCSRRERFPLFTKSAIRNPLTPSLQTPNPQCSDHLQIFHSPELKPINHPKTYELPKPTSHHQHHIPPPHAPLKTRSSRREEAHSFFNPIRNPTHTVPDSK